MADLSDEELMAYADGQLDPAEQANVEASIRERPEHQRKVEKFRATLKPVHQAFQERMDRGHLALAASLALAVGGGLGWFMHSSPQRDPTAADLITFGDGSLQAEGALAQLLETAKSGAVLSVRDEHGRAWQLKTIFSFRSMADVPCRRYELSNGATERFAGYACRDSRGRWHIEAHARIDAKVNGKPVFSPAGDSHENPVDSAIRMYMNGDVLQSSDELRLIEKHWSEGGGK